MFSGDVEKGDMLIPSFDWRRSGSNSHVYSQRSSVIPTRLHSHFFTVVVFCGFLVLILYYRWGLDWFVKMVFSSKAPCLRKESIEKCILQLCCLRRRQFFNSRWKKPWFCFNSWIFKVRKLNSRANYFRSISSTLKHNQELKLSNSTHKLDSQLTN